MVLHEAVGGLLAGIASGVVLGIAALLVMYKMIDGDLHFAPGLLGFGTCIVLVFVAAKPPHPALPGVVLLVALALMMVFPFAESQLEKLEMRWIDTERLERAYQTFAARPDNLVAQLEIAKGLYIHGFRAHAIAAASKVIRGLGTELDPLQNRSQRDLFRQEEAMLRSWEREAAANPPSDTPLECRGCKHINPIGTLACEKCGRTYLLEHARELNVRPRVWSRLVAAWAAIGLLLVASSAIGLHFTGPVLLALVLACVVPIGLLLHWLFKPPAPKWR